MTAPAAPAPLVRKVGQIFVNAHDLDRAVAFYRDRVGLRFLFQVPRMAFFQCGELTVMLGIAESAEFDHPASLLYFDVADIADAHRTMRGRGVEFRTDPHPVHREPGRELWLADFRDTEGNTMALMSWKSGKHDE
jgi:methylmalonyl-CoA/ethylmalonyl-CoA epimerase